MRDLFIFDMGGVMAESCPTLPRAAAALGVGEAELLGLVREDFDAITEGRLGTEEFWRRFSARTGLAARENYWATLFAPRADPAMAALARALRSRGRVVCGTNTIDVHYAYHLEQGQYGCFDAVYASHLMGLSKPRPEFWLSILEAEGRGPERALFVDDLAENVEAARELGIDGRLFRGAEPLIRELEAEYGLELAARPGH